MACKYYIPDGASAPGSQIGATLEALAATIRQRRSAGEESYSCQLLTGPADAPLKKLMEEAGEVALAAKDLEAVSGEGRDALLDHLRYESADVVYHLLVVLERYGIGIDELAAELNSRMTEAERPAGAALIRDGHINRG